MSKVHIGNKIKEVVKELRYSTSDFAKLINITTDGAYKIYEKEIIDIDRLTKICKVLNYDFYRYLSDGLELGNVSEPEDNYTNTTKIDSAMLEKMAIQIDEIHALINAKNGSISKEYRREEE